MLRVNLLNRSSFRWNMFLVGVLALFLLALILGYGFKEANQNYAIAIQSFDNGLISLLQNGNKNWLEEYTILQNEVTKLDSLLQELNNDTNSVQLLHRMIRCLPENIRLTKIKTSARGNFLFEGESINYNQLANWIKDLKQIDKISDIRLLYFRGEEQLTFALQADCCGDNG